MKIFNFKSKKESELKPMGVKKTVERPFQPVNRLSDDELQKLISDTKKEKEKIKSMDPYFLQEISDRLFGPEAEDYIKAIKELNSKYKPRAGRTGHDIFKIEK
jgi:hypothetical protein